MKRTMLILGLLSIGICGGAQTMIQPTQVRVDTNAFTLGVTTNLSDVFRWQASHLTQSGTCTNNQVVTFSNAFASVPSVSACWSMAATNAWLYVSAVTKTNFVVGSTSARTNAIYWIAR